MNMTSRKLYRSREGELFGVCQGIADWRDLPVDSLRLVVAIAIVVTGVFPGLVIYSLLALLLPLEPGYGTRYSRQQQKHRDDGRERYTREDLRSAFESLKRKVETMEEEVLDKESDWDHRFNQTRK